MPRTIPTIVAAGGVLAIAAAGFVRFSVVPDRAQLPADTDVTAAYTGTVDAILSADALAAGDLANVLLTDIPATITRNVMVTGTDGDVATVNETATVTAPDGTVLIGTNATFDLDRRTMEGVGERDGLLIGWPIGTEQRDYTGWSTDLQDTVDLTFVGTEEHAGIDTYVFSTDVSGQIVDPELLSLLPASLPKALLPQVAAALDLPEALASRLPAILEALPEDVPMQYAVQSNTTYWVEPTTGIVVDLDRVETRTIAFDVDGVPAIPLADVFSISYTGEEASVAARVADATDKANQLQTFGTTVPVGLTVLGVVLLGVAFLLGRRRPQEIDLTDASSSTEPRELHHV